MLVGCSICQSIGRLYHTHCALYVEGREVGVSLAGGGGGAFLRWDGRLGGARRDFERRRRWSWAGRLFDRGGLRRGSRTAAVREHLLEGTGALVGLLLCLGELIQELFSVPGRVTPQILPLIADFLLALSESQLPLKPGNNVT